jgi:hypothetical protein
LGGEDGNYDDVDDDDGSGGYHNVTVIILISLHFRVQIIEEHLILVHMTLLC